MTKTELDSRREKSTHSSLRWSILLCDTVLYCDKVSQYSMHGAILT